MNATSLPDPTSDYTVFISHRIKDKNVAYSIKDLLTQHTANVDYFVSEDIEKGENWRKIITTQLHTSHLLVLVFTDPHEDWSWCLYETGFFDALTQLADKTQTRRIHCLHHPDTGPPKPIADLQTVPATPEEIIRWLKDLFDQTHQPMTAYRNNTEIPQLADQISGFFHNGHRPLYSTKSVNVEVDCNLLDSRDDLPANSILDGDDGLMEELFGTYRGKIDWATAKKRFDQFPDVSEANLNALKEISRAVYCIYKNNRVLPLQSTIFVGRGPKRYRPIISHAKELSTSRIGCQILLIEEVGGPLQNVDRRLGALLTAMRMALRIRWEIVRPFVLDSNVRILAVVNARKLRSDLQICLNNIFMEAEFRGNFSPIDVWGAFESTADRDKIEAMIRGWEELYPKIWRSLGFPNVSETFNEVCAHPFSDEDIALLDAGMRQLEEINRDFLDMAVARAKALVHGDLAN
jgi:hypothetical protein